MNKIFKDKDGNIVIGQKPNLPIIIAFGFWLAALIAKTGPSHNILYGLFLASLAWWSFLELISGVNYFRRILGTLVLVFIAYKIVTIFV